MYPLPMTRFFRIFEIGIGSFNAEDRDTKGPDIVGKVGGVSAIGEVGARETTWESDEDQ